jgi:hypothetical protein
MFRTGFILRVTALLSTAAVFACGDNPVVIGTNPPAVQPHLRVQVKGLDLDLAGREITLTPGDSLVVQAFVENRPEAYGVPEISASDPSMIERLSDGTYIVRRAGTLNLTATAFAKSSSEQPPLLMESARINIACTADMRAGLVLAVRDSVSGASVANEKTRRVRATGATRVDSATVSPTGALVTSGVFPGGDGRWSLAWESAGTWSVEIDADGYGPWRQDGIVVPRGICHVMTVNITARLSPI